MSVSSRPAPRCHSCGAPAPEGGAACSYCRATLGWGPTAPVAPRRSVRAAATDWGRSVFGAPRNLAELIQSVLVRDEVFDRITTETVRREIREQRLPTGQRRPSAPRVDPATVDPFAISIPALRAASEYVTSCSSCGGSGAERCAGCAGSGRMSCRTCGGGGQVRRQYQRSSRLVKCTVCRGACTVTCGGCGGRGAVACPGCTASGQQVAWLAYGEESRIFVSIAPESPVLLAHRQLGEQRPLGAAELGAFGTIVSVDAAGPLEPREGMDGAFLRAQTSSIDSRVERVKYQQYLKLSILRRDATYQMCGATGVLVLSGNNLLAAHSGAAAAPIRLRLNLWIGASMAILVATSAFFGSLMAAGAYFDRANMVLVVLAVATVVLADLFAGAFLRELRPRLAFGRLKPIEKLVGLSALAAVCLGVVVAIASRPRVKEVQQALAAGDLPRARVIVDALHSTKGDTPEVRDAADTVSLAEASLLPGDRRLKTLDEVVARNGTHAAAARGQARAERRQEIQALIQQGDSTDALADISRWFPSWSADAGIAEDRARAWDVAYTACIDDACRFSTATEATVASTTPNRSTRSSESRRNLMASLSFAEVPAEPSLARLHRLGSLATIARATSAVASADPELAERAQAAATLAQAERGKVPLMNADGKIVDELLGHLTDVDPKTAVVEMKGVGVYLTLDVLKKCRGIYVAGTTSATRSDGLGGDATNHVLSQAVGHEAMVKAPTGGGSTSRWSDGATAILARWHGGTLVELRIGDAAP